MSHDHHLTRFDSLAVGQKSYRLLTAVIVALAVAGGCASGPQSLANVNDDIGADIDADVVAGQWVGAFHSYPSIIILTITVGDDGQGELTAEAITSRGAKSATMAVSMRIDPETRTVFIDPGAVVERGGRVAARVRVPEMIGVFSPSMDAIGGIVSQIRSDSSPHFVLGRAGSGAEFETKARDVAKRGNRADGLGGMFSKPSTETILAWAKEFEQEYPSMDPYRTEQGRLYTAARPLFADDIMLKHFGETYDGLGGTGRAGIAMQMRPQNKDLRRFSGLARGFGASGTYTDDDIMVSILALRVIGAWRDAITDRLEVVSATEDTLNELEGLKNISDRVLASLFPSQRVSLSAPIESARHRIAEPILTVRCDALLAGIDLETARRIRNWTTTNNSLLAYATQARRSEWFSQLNSHLATILDQEVTKRARILTGFPATLDGLANGVQAYAEFRETFEFAWDHPSVHGALTPMARERAAVLDQLRPTIEARIASMRSRSELQRFVEQYLSAPGDSDGRAIGLVSAKLREYDREEAHNRAVTYLLLALGADILGGEAMKDAKWLDAMIAGALSEYGRQRLIELAAAEIAFDRTPAEQQEIEALLKEYFRTWGVRTAAMKPIADEIEAQLRKEMPDADDQTVIQLSRLIFDWTVRWDELNSR